MAASDPAPDADPELAVMKALLLARRLRQGGRIAEATSCEEAAFRLPADPSRPFPPAARAHAYGRIVAYCADIGEWTQARHAYEGYVLHNDAAPLDDERHLGVLIAAARSYFELADHDRVEEIMVEALARSARVHGRDSDPYRQLLANLATAREHKMFAGDARRPTRTTRVDDGGVAVDEVPHPVKEFIADFHRRTVGEAFAQSPPAAVDGLARRLRKILVLLKTIGFVYVLAALLDLTLTLSFDVARETLGIAPAVSHWLGLALAFVTGTVGARAGGALAQLHSPYVATVTSDPARETWRIAALRLDLSAWGWGAAWAVVVLAGWFAVLRSPSAATAGVAFGWLAWIVLRDWSAEKVLARIASENYVLLLRRFGSGALFRFPAADLGVVAVFDPSRRDLWAPVHLARLFVERRRLDIIQIALADDVWHDVVWSLAKTSSAVALDLDGYATPERTVSGLMQETELFLFLRRPVVFLARRRDDAVPAWLPNPLLVLTDGRTRAEIRSDLAAVFALRFDARTIRRLELHRAKIHAEFDFLRAEMRRDGDAGAAGERVLRALLATGEWSPQTAWRDEAE